MTREELLPLLQQCVLSTESTPLPAAALAALRELGGDGAQSAPLLRTLSALEAARAGTETRVLLARALRELAQIPSVANASDSAAISGDETGQRRSLAPRSAA